MLVVCMVAACYQPRRLDCAVSCANGAACPGGLTCGTDELCHSGSLACSPVDASVGSVDAAAPIDSFDPPKLAFCDPAQPDLVACYEFERSGNDASNNKLNATMTRTFALGKVGDALALARDSMVRIAESPILDLHRFTIEAWLDLQQSTNNNKVTVVNNAFQYGMFIDTNNAPYCAFVTDTAVGIAAEADAPLAMDRWTHVACVYNGALLTLYVDGAEAKTNTQGGTVATMPTLGIGIGSDDFNTGAANHFVGLIDELKISSAPRTAAQICADAGRTFTPPRSCQ